MYIGPETILYHDIEGFPVHKGSIMAYTDGWCETHPELDIEGKLFQIIGYDEESGELGFLEITDQSGEWFDFRANYTIPVQWEWNYRKFSAI